MHYVSDLHTHSTASDGQYTPIQLIQTAKERGLEALALTDHDTMDGLAEAIQAGKQCGLHIIPGIELSAKEYPAFHILGYGFSLNAPPLAELCRRMKANRDERTGRLLAFLKEKGIELTAKEIPSPPDRRQRFPRGKSEAGCGIGGAGFRCGLAVGTLNDPLCAAARTGNQDFIRYGRMRQSLFCRKMFRFIC